MGRKLKYKTIDEQINAKRRWRLTYYYKNKKEICKKYMEKYYETRENELPIP